MENHDPVRIKVLDELEVVTAISALGRAIGWYLVCDVCHREREPLVALMMTVAEPPRFHAACGACFRELCKHFAGQIM